MNRVRASGGMLLGALVSSALTLGTLGEAPAANASCISAFGIGNGGGCTSNLTSFAIAIGTNATANAGNGFFSGAISLGASAATATTFSFLSFAVANGEQARASTLPGLLNFAWQQGGPGSSAALGALNFAIGMMMNGAGPQSTGVAGLGNIALQIGPGTMTNIGSLNLTLASALAGDGSKATNAGGFGNLALNVGDAGTAWTQGFFSSATNFLGDSIVRAQGILTAAGNILGNGNTVSSWGPFPPNTTLSLAFNFFGDNNTVTAGWGPFAIAGAISQSLKTITRSLPGIDINGGHRRRRRGCRKQQAGRHPPSCCIGRQRLGRDYDGIRCRDQEGHQLSRQRPEARDQPIAVQRQQQQGGGCKISPRRQFRQEIG